jgi:hypothetical protein
MMPWKGPCARSSRATACWLVSSLASSNSTRSPCQWVQVGAGRSGGGGGNEGGEGGRGSAMVDGGGRGPDGPHAAPRLYWPPLVPILIGHRPLVGPGGGSRGPALPHPHPHPKATHHCLGRKPLIVRALEAGSHIARDGPAGGVRRVHEHLPHLVGVWGRGAGQGRAGRMGRTGSGSCPWGWGTTRHTLHMPRHVPGMPPPPFPRLHAISSIGHDTNCLTSSTSSCNPSNSRDRASCTGAG